MRGNLFPLSIRRLERASEFAGNVLSVDEDAVVIAQKFRLRLADCFEVSDAHRDKFEVRMSKSETISNDE